MLPSSQCLATFGSRDVNFYLLDATQLAEPSLPFSIAEVAGGTPFENNPIFGWRILHVAGEGCGFFGAIWNFFTCNFTCNDSVFAVLPRTSAAADVVHVIGRR